MAFLPCVGLCDYEVMRQVGNSVGCPLSGRYVLGGVLCSVKYLAEIKIKH